MNTAARHDAGYRAEVDGLRAIAVLPVLFYHAGFPVFSGGFVGVDIFFVISGYLISTIILRDLQTGTFSFSRFYERRFRRILPVLFAVLLVSTPPALLWMQPVPMTDFFEALIAVVFFGSNILFWQQSDYFAEDAETNPLLHTWSLSVEEQFYLVFPLALWILWKRGWSARFLFTLTILVGSFALSEWGWRNSSVANFYLLPTRMWELLLGAGLSIVLASSQGSRKPPRRLAETLSWSGICLIGWSVFAYTEQTPFPSAYALAPTVGTLLVLAFAGPGTLLGRLLSAPSIVFVGLISYSLYLWHQPIFAFARILSLHEPGGMAFLGLIILSFGFASVSWRLIERPFRDTARISRRTLSVSLLACAGIIVTTAVCGLAGLIGPGEERIQASRFVDQGWHDRHVRIKSGICHFNTLGPATDISSFVAQWDCWGEPVEGLGRILVVGDSHAADKALALWQNGADVGLLSGGDCSLDPQQMRANCQRLFQLAIDGAHSHQVQTILLSNRYASQEMTEDALNRTIAFWGQTQARLIVSSAMPVFDGFRSILTKAVYRNLDWDSLGLVRDDSVARVSEDRFSAMASQHSDVDFVNVKSIFCTLSSDCGWRSNETVLMADLDHLSIDGARLFGAELLAKLVELAHR